MANVGAAAEHADINYNTILTGVVGGTTLGRVQVTNLHTAAATISVFVASNAFADGVTVPTGAERIGRVFNRSLDSEGLVADLRFVLTGTQKLVVRSDNAAGVAVVAEGVEA